MRVRITDRPAARFQRSGFTLLELLMAIVIIAILVALLIPAVNAAMTKARVAHVGSDISGLSSGISDFRAKFNLYPPSRIILYENATGGTASWASDTTDAFSPTLLANSKTFIRSIWPQFDFSIDRDINGNGVIDSPGRIELTGPECLVFFLGGMRNTEDANGNLTLDTGEDVNGNSAIDVLDGVAGFSPNPQNPFARGGNNRVGPFHDFPINRLVDLDNDGMYEFLDPLPSQTRPYVYASANEGAGYRTAALGIAGVDDLLGTGMTDIYRQTATGTPPYGTNVPPAWNPKMYQLISPGFDGEYGVGGSFVENTVETDFTTRPFERDNITNFHSGMLAP